jgi:uncharacterized membrane protein
LRNQDQKASDGRASLHTKTDGLRNDFQDWRGKLEAVITDVAEMKPAVDEMRTAQAARDRRADGEPRPVCNRHVHDAGVTWLLANWIKVSIR